MSWAEDIPTKIIKAWKRILIKSYTAISGQWPEILDKAAMELLDDSNNDDHSTGRQTACFQFLSYDLENDFEESDEHGQSLQEE